MPSKHSSQSLRNSDNSLSCNAQAKSFEMLEFDDFDFDGKSKSFDDDFCFNTKVTRNGKNSENAFSGNRALSQDRVMLTSSKVSQSLRNSPKNYGSRLYDHDNFYDATNRREVTRSPMKNFNARPSFNPSLSRERSPVSGRRHRDVERENKKKQAKFLKPHTTNLNRSPSHSPSDSDENININPTFKNKSLVEEYLFGLKRKQQTKLNWSGNLSAMQSSSGRY